jgi:hypothetical protein
MGLLLLGWMGVGTISHGTLCLLVMLGQRLLLVGILCYLARRALGIMDDVGATCPLTVPLKQLLLLSWYITMIVL